MEGVRPRIQSAISGTWLGIASSASVAATTAADGYPRAGLQQGCAAGAESDHRQFSNDQVHRAHRRDGERACLHDLRSALGRVLHGHDDTLGARYQIHGSAHARHHLPGDHPVGQSAGLIDLQATEHREVEMTAANEAERHGAVEGAGAGERRHRTAARVGQRGMRHPLLRRRAGADQTVLGLEENMQALRHVVRDQRRNSNAEIDEHARRKLPGDPTRDDRLRFHSPLMDWRRDSRQRAPA